MSDYSDEAVMVQYDRNRAALRPKADGCMVCGCRYLALEREPAEMDHSERLCVLCATWIDTMAVNRNLGRLVMAHYKPVMN